jgi:hypothetical protein
VAPLQLLGADDIAEDLPAATWRLPPGLPGSGARRWPVLGSSLAGLAVSAEIEEGLKNGDRDESHAAVGA